MALLRTLKRGFHRSLALASLATAFISNNSTAQSCTPPPTGLVAWWPGEGNAIDNVAGHNGSVSNGVTFVQGVVGQAFSFDGVHSIQVPDDSAFDFGPTSTMSVELWAYLTGSQPTAHFIGKRVGCDGDNFNYQMAYDAENGLQFSCSNLNGVYTGIPMPTNIWTHLAATFDGTTFRFYINGSLVASNNGVLGPINSEPLVIGCSGACGVFEGLIDEPSIYNRALSATEIQSIYDSGSAGKCTVIFSNQPPVIVAQPASQTIGVGSNVTFFVTATSAAPLQYQWLFNNTNIPGALGSSYTLSNVQPSDAGNYSVVITNIAGITTSSNALLTVIGNTNVAPAITSQPASQIVNAGTNVTFSVVATGTAPLHYQWRFNNTNIAGATSNILTRLNVQTASAGNYSVVITNIAGGIISSNALLTVSNVAPTITSQPASQIVNAGTNVTFRVIATGTTPMFYQWRFNNTNIAGAISSIFTRSNVQTTNSGNYSVAISNSIATVISSNALLTVIGNTNVAPTITSQPASQVVNAGTNVTFSVVATGTAPLHYQWRFNNTNIAGATSNVLTRLNVQTTNSGNYSVVITNIAGGTISSNALLTVISNTTNIAPTVVIVSPTNNTAYGTISNVFVSASVADVDGFVTKLEFLSGTNLIRLFAGQLTNGFYTFNWQNLPAGLYSLTAKATDDSGGVTTTAPVTFTVGSSNRPVVTVTAIDPEAAEASPGGITNTGAFRIQRSSSTPASLAVQFTMSGTAATNDYTLTPATGIPGSIRTAIIPAGSNSVTITLRATLDGISEGSETAILTLRTNPVYDIGVPGSATITITDASSNSNHPPTVSLTYPADGTTFYSGRNLPFTALVDDNDANATSIDLLVDDQVIASHNIVMSSPGTNMFSVFTNFQATLSQGSHVVRARATDTSGAVAISSPVTLQVLGIANRPPASPKLGTMSLASSTYFIDGEGILYAWGLLYGGHLGTTNPPATYPVVQLLGDTLTTGWSEIAGGHHTIAIDNSGRMFGWGRNSSGQLGLGFLSYTDMPPTAVSAPIGAAGWKKVAVASSYTLAIDTEGRLFGWGDNSSKGLAFDAPDSLPSPTMVPFPANVTAWRSVAAGNQHSVAIADDGNIYSWGANDYAQIGNGVASYLKVATPFRLPFPDGVSGWKQVSAGVAFTLALSTDGQVFAWGANENGQTGSGSNSIAQTTIVKVPFPDGTMITEIASGNSHSLALASDGKLYAWGWNGLGQLGNNSVTNYFQNSPVQVAFPVGVTAWENISASTFNSFAIGNDCRVYGWGNNSMGEIGDGTLVNRRIPTPTINLGNVCTAPLVSITSPLDGTVFPYPGNVFIAADASSHDNQVTEVALFQGTNKLASLTSPPYTFTWTNLPVGNYTVITTAHDNLGVTNVSDPVSFSVVFVNHAPTFTAGPDQTVTEDSGSVVLPGWASNISSGSTYETNQTVEFSVSNSDDTLFATQPAIDAAGNLTFTPAPDAFGTAVVSLQLHDNGGTANGGQDTSEVQTFVITILPVNDAPSFTKGPDQIVLEDAASQNLPAWATGISAGPANEAGQLLLFNVSNNNHALFSAQPAIDASGTLTYSLAANANGTATVTVQLQDDGGTGNGGSDLSVNQTFTITVLPVNDAPLAESQSVTVNEDSTVAITLTASDVENDPLSYVLLTAPVHGTLTGNGANLVYHPNANYFGSDTFTFKANDGQVDSGVATVTITVNPVNDAPVAVARIAPLFVLSTNDTDLVVIAPDSMQATVVFDGSLSTDIENDPLQFAWLDETTTNILGQTMVATNTLSVGTNTVSLILNDGTDTSTNTIQVEVITPVDAVSKLASVLQEVDLGGVNKHPFIAALHGAKGAFGRGQSENGVLFLEKFEDRLLQQTSPAYNESVARLIYIANEIIEATTPPPGNQ